ncbi:MAG: hypothetical protein A4E40_01184 [Methanoregulaceae archaeon PtaU1.Bin059]|nr:MAG: hypothetical protein A4E39_00953 [Methanoregulaceae archaeon PtaB.Bin152]OPY39229.1 MAG: hypothetical protein A4E40_01184 [Methanoregulaceae archaeon PtaU1.Bin059]
MMRKTLALCLLLGIILLPATVMAAGTMGQGRTGVQGGAGVLQEQADETASAGQYQFCASHGLDDVQKTGNGEMRRIRSCSGDGEMRQAKTMARDQARLRDGSCGNCPSL